MRPNLSVEKIAGALAVLGTSVLMAACGGDKPANAPVNSTETPTTPTTGDAKPADGHCGAGKDHKAGETACGAAKGGDTAAKPADTTSTTAPATPAMPDTKAADSKTGTPDPKAATPAASGSAKPKTPAPAASGKKGGGASCGAGTCSAKK